ncbi:MAG: hypothetical protein OXR66_09340 [Candidatus Woesearchaeota archaeon]|nr:hypothetical protein [Candidatus Woesearchaeota archaeon]
MLHTLIKRTARIARNAFTKKADLNDILETISTVNAQEAAAAGKQGRAELTGRALTINGRIRQLNSAYLGNVSYGVLSELEEAYSETKQTLQLLRQRSTRGTSLSLQAESMYIKNVQSDLTEQLSTLRTKLDNENAARMTGKVSEPYAQIAAATKRRSWDTRLAEMNRAFADIKPNELRSNAETAILHSAYHKMKRSAIPRSRKRLHLAYEQLEQKFESNLDTAAFDVRKTTQRATIGRVGGWVATAALLLGVVSCGYGKPEETFEPKPAEQTVSAPATDGPDPEKKYVTLQWADGTTYSFEGPADLIRTAPATVEKLYAEGKITSDPKFVITTTSEGSRKHPFSYEQLLEFDFSAKASPQNGPTTLAENTTAADTPISSTPIDVPTPKNTDLTSVLPEELSVNTPTYSAHLLDQIAQPSPNDSCFLDVRLGYVGSDSSYSVPCQQLAEKLLTRDTSYFDLIPERKSGRILIQRNNVHVSTEFEKTPEGVGKIQKATSELLQKEYLDVTAAYMQEGFQNLREGLNKLIKTAYNNSFDRRTDALADPQNSICAVETPQKKLMTCDKLPLPVPPSI